MHRATHCALYDLLVGRPCRREGQLNVQLAVGAKCLLNQAILSSTALDLGIIDLVSDCTTASM